MLGRRSPRSASCAPHERDVELVGALDHVRARRDDVAAVLAGLALEALGDLLRDRGGRRHRQAEQEVAGRLGQVEDDRLVVGVLMPEIVFALPLPYVVEALDRRV